MENTTEPKNKHGGAGRGQGRKPDPLHEKVKNFNTTLKPSIKIKAVDLFGSISNAVKWAVEQKESENEND